MSYTRFKGSFLSTNKKSTVNYYICEPESEVRAVILIAHGWVDCFDRNNDMIDYFCNHGILVCGCDVTDFDTHHLFRKKSAWTYLVNDLKKFSHYLKKSYPDYPFFLYGHGLGSLVARIAVMNHSIYDGVIFSGTSGKQRFCHRAFLTSEILKIVRGPEYTNSIISKMIQYKVNHRFRKEKDPKAWTCSDPERRMINNLGAEGTVFYTMDALRDMFYMLSIVSDSNWYRSVPSELPILLLSGSEDSISSYGKGIMAIEKELKKQHTKVTVHIYKGMRHNIQDEPEHEKVFEDILSWIKSYIDE